MKAVKSNERVTLTDEDRIEQLRAAMKAIVQNVKARITN